MAAPLPERIRPASLDEVVGQPTLIGPAGVLTRLIAAGHLPSLLLWGPPGCGKTYSAQMIATELELPLNIVRLSSVISSYVGETASAIVF